MELSKEKQVNPFEYYTRLDVSQVPLNDLIKRD